MKRRLPPAPPEMPARLRLFDPAEWGVDPEADRDNPEMLAAQSQHTSAWLAWCHEYDVSPLDVILQRRRERRLTDDIAERPPQG